MSAAQDVRQVVDTMEKYDFFARLPWMRIEFLGNPVYHYILTLLTFIALWGILLGIRKLVTNRLSDEALRERSPYLAFTSDLIKNIYGFVIPAVALYFAMRRLDMPPSVTRYLTIACMAIVVIQAAKIVSEVFVFILTHNKNIDTCDLSTRNANRNIVMLVKFAVWIAGILFILDNAGFNVGTFIAGLGIGGVAIALASQAILGDTFSSFAISLDKPFQPGDFIVVDDFQGTVEQIGLKTTRARSVNGELLILSNTDLCKSRVRNYKRMHERRVVTKIGVTYETSFEKLKGLPHLLTAILAEQKQVRIDRVHFASYGDSALIFEMVYFVLSPDMKVSMDIQQDVNFRIFEEFEKQKIAMAFPSRTVYVVPQKDA